MTVAVIGIGNEFRRDDGIGPTIARAVAERTRPPVRVVVCDGDPTVLLEAWAGAELAVVVDAVTGAVPRPGVVHRIVGDDLATAGTGAVSTHGLGLADAYRLGAALHRLPQRWVLYGVEVADVGVGCGMSPPIERAAATVVSAVLSEIAAACVETPRVGSSDGPAFSASADGNDAAVASPPTCRDKIT